MKSDLNRRIVLAMSTAVLSASIATTQALAEVEEIIVSATKREQTLQDVPIAVSAYSTDQLEKAGVTDIRSLVSLSPNLSVQTSNSESGGSTFRLRGVGTTGNNAGLEGAVGVFLDGVYLSRPGIAFQDFLDLEQIEVLRGPQGTLFGRNTSAGAISIRTKKPNFDGYEFDGAATYGNYNAYTISAAANLPVSEQLAFRVSGNMNSRDGYRESIFSGLESNDRDRWAIRGQALWAPSDAFNLRLIADYMDADGEQCCDAMIRTERGEKNYPPAGATEPQLTTLVASPVPIVVGGALGGFGSGFGGRGDGISLQGGQALDDRHTNSNRIFENPQEQWGFSAEAGWSLNGVDVTYIGSYRDYDTSQNGEVDFTSLDILRIDNSTGTVETMSHELRLQGVAGRLDWLVGAYYSDETITSSQRIAPGTDYYTYAQSLVNLTRAGIALSTAGAVILPEFETLVDPLGVVDGASGVYPSTPTINNFEQEGQSYSIFTHNVLSLTDRLDLTLGARFIHEEKDAVFDQVDGTAAPGCTNAAPALRAARSSGVFDPATSGIGTIAGVFPNGKTTADETFEIWLAFSCFPFLNGEVPEFDQSFEDDALTGVASLAFDLTDEINVYGTYSRGFKAGGFNLDPTAAVVNPLDSTTVGDASFKSETVDSYELGLKGRFFNGVLQTNMALFHMDIEDIQVLEFDGVQFVVNNVSEAKSTGAEFEAIFSPTDGLIINSSIAYVDSRYPSDVVNDGPGTVGFEVAGRQLTNAPRWVMQAGFTYEFMIPNTNFKSFVHADGRYDAKRLTGSTPADQRFYFTDTDDEVLDGKVQGETIKLNLRAGIGDPEDRWSLEAWGRNITDETSSQIVFGIPLRGGALGAFTDDPATYGVTLRVSF